MENRSNSNQINCLYLTIIVKNDQDVNLSHICIILTFRYKCKKLLTTQFREFGHHIHSYVSYTKHRSYQMQCIITQCILLM